MIRPRSHILLAGFGLMVAGRISGMAFPASMKLLVDEVISGRHPEFLTPLAAAVIAGSVLQAIATHLQTRLLSQSAHELIADLRQRMQRHILSLPVSFYDKNKSGALVARIMHDVEGLRHLLGASGVEFVGGLITAGISLIVLVRISPLLTVLALGFLIPLTVVIRWRLRGFRPAFHQRGRAYAEVTGRLTESLAGVRVIKGYHAERREAETFSLGVRRLLKLTLDTAQASSLLSTAGNLTLGCAGGIVMYAGAQQVLTGAMTFGDLLTFSAFLMLLAAPAMQTAQIGSQMAEAMAGFDRCREVLQEQPENTDPQRRHRLETAHGEVRFEDVHFSYETGKPVLNGVSFDARPGTVTAFVGPSGAGKSTIISLIAGFYAPQRGRVLVDGIDLATVKLESWRAQLGVVLQETFLFDGSIRENVAFSRPGATEEEILDACRVAGVDEFAERFPERYDTIVGERGVKLSGGQKQRVSIARAILADPKILILDEATSSLDSESEALVQEGLAYLMRGRTTFVIAHRLSTIQGADQILVVHDGLILERGAHGSLHRSRGRYYELHTRLAPDHV